MLRVQTSSTLGVRERLEQLPLDQWGGSGVSGPVSRLAVVARKSPASFCLWCSVLQTPVGMGGVDVAVEKGAGPGAVLSNQLATLFIFILQSLSIKDGCRFFPVSGPVYFCYHSANYGLQWMCPSQTFRAVGCPWFLPLPLNPQQISWLGSKVCWFLSSTGYSLNNLTKLSLEQRWLTKNGHHVAVFMLFYFVWNSWI